ncbi:hypothetical protein JL722_11720 [Aureococcus anophagefferens]|nr:hypothetical protein JL722_11720 [Aureococcus anophagefferens]
MRRARTASGGSEEVARDTSRPRTDDLEDGVPLPLLKHGIEVLRALATAAASTAERRVARKDINSKPPHGSWQALFDASKPSSLVARGYAAKGYGAGPDYGRYWITAAGLEYLAAVDRAAVLHGEAAGYTLRFLSFFKSPYGLAHVVWDFGCPGHGKGPWDGIAGMLKSWLLRTALTHSMDKVDRGPKDCADRLRAHFETNAWRAAHDAPKYKIKRVVVDWTGEGDIKRPSHWECGAGGTVVHAVRSTEVAPLRGVSENYSYCMLRPGFTINGINFKKGRLLVYCYDLARVHDDPARRTFELEPTPAPPARMVRRRARADDAGDALTPADTPRTGLSAAFAAVDGRLVVLSEAENAKTVAACAGDSAAAVVSARPAPRAPRDDL